LADALVGEAKLTAQLPQGARWVTIQAIASHNHLMQAVGELREKGEQDLVDQGLLQSFIQVGSPAGGARQQLTARVTYSLGGSTMNVATDSYPGIGGEGGAPRRVVVQNSPPEANAPGLQSLLVGQRATPLPPYDGVDQPLVTMKGLLDTGRSTYWGSNRWSVAQWRRARMDGILKHEIPPFGE